MTEDLKALLHSPELSLEPPPALADVVRREAHRRRRTTRVAGALTAVALVAAGAVAAPHITGSVGNLRDRANAASRPKADPRAPHATSEVLTLRTVNRAELLTWFEGSQWCTKTTRVTSQITCLGPVDPAHQGFSWVVPVHSPSVTVDDQYFVAGVAPPRATRIIVQMSDGRQFDTSIVAGYRFPVSVWSSDVVNLSYGRVAAYVAYDSTGAEIARKAA